MQKLTLIIVILSSLTGCFTKVEYRQVPLELPPDYRIYPKIAKNELLCLNETTMSKLKVLSIRRQARSEELEATIKTTWTDQ